MPSRRQAKRRLKRCGKLFANSDLARLWWRNADRGERLEHLIHVVLCTVGSWLIGLCLSLPVGAVLMSIYNRGSIGADSSSNEDLFVIVATVVSHALFWSFGVGLPVAAALADKERRLETFARHHLETTRPGRSDLCFACGYDLSHARSLACPECGTRATSHLAELRR